MGLLMGEEYAQRDAQRKREKRGATRMTVRSRRAIARRMPDMSKEAYAAYDPEKVRAAMKAVRDRLGLVNRPWAEKAGVSEATLRAFLNEATAKPGKEPEEPTYAPLISFFVRLAWAAGVTVGELIGEAQPVELSVPHPTQPIEAPSQSDLLTLNRILVKTQENLLAAEQREFEWRRRFDELEREVRLKLGMPPSA